jgi:hypothetical protein
MARAARAFSVPHCREPNRVKVSGRSQTLPDVFNVLARAVMLSA